MSNTLTTETDRLKVPLLATEVQIGELYAATAANAHLIAQLPEDVSLASPSSLVKSRKKRVFKADPNYKAKLRIRPRYTPLDKPAKKRKVKEGVDNSALSEILKKRVSKYISPERVPPRLTQEVEGAVGDVLQSPANKKTEVALVKTPQEGNFLSRLANILSGNKQKAPINPYKDTGAKPKISNPFANIALEGIKPLPPLIPPSVSRDTPRSKPGESFKSPLSAKKPKATSTPRVPLNYNEMANRIVDGPGMRMVESLPNFSGGPTQRFDDWISKFEHICSFTNWNPPEMAQILVTKMTDLAYDVIQDVLEQGVNTYAELKDKLIERFHGSETIEYYHEKFDKCARKTGETIPNYAFRLKKTFKKAFPTEETVSQDVQRQSDAMLRRQFLKGLEPPLRAKVRYKQLDTFQELVTETTKQDIRFQQESNEKEKHEFINAVTPNSTFQMDELLKLLKNQSINAFQPQPAEQRPSHQTLPLGGVHNNACDKKPRYKQKFKKIIPKKKFNGNCGYCGKYGHKAEECFIKKKHDANNSNKQEKPTIKCYSCKETGHCALQCPNKDSKTSGNSRPTGNE